MTTYTTAMKTFINAERFAVIGRVLSDRSRYDNKVLRWYQNHGLPITPIRPNQDNSKPIESLTVLSDALQLPSLSQTSISIIINPILGLPILKSLFPPPSSGTTTQESPRAVWFQPGAESVEIANFIKERGIEDRVIFGGPCILVLGEGLMNAHRVVGSKGKM